MATIILLLLSSCSILQINSIRAHGGYTRSEKLTEGYSLEWTVDLKIKEIAFSVRAHTLGYVGFGISPNKGAMDGADMIIGGVGENGIAYFTDGHGIGQNFIKDKIQDWILLDAFESNGWTTLKFKRTLRPCDHEEDVPITEDTLRVIYSYGETDQAGYHQDKRGVQSLRLLNPTNRVAKDTSSFNVLNFEAMLSTIEAQTHVHHMLGYRCTTLDDPVAAAYLEALSNTSGGMQNDPSVQRAYLYCREFFFGWAIGGYPVFFPNDIGVPLGRPENPECIRLETHINNPESLKGLKIETGMTLYYTKELRKYESGGLEVGTVVAPHLIIPPGINKSVHAGHCSSTCTSASFPQGGVKVFAVNLHTHIRGRKIKVRHFRGTTELPWLAADDHYDFNYQQFNMYREHVQLLPGDQLTTECVYDTADATHQGEPTSQEMCLAFFLVYPYVRDLSYCVSSFWPPEQVLHPLGIGSLSSLDPVNPVVTSPLEMKGLTLVDALNTKVNWTEERIKNLQDQMRWKKQRGTCMGDKTLYFVPDVSYPINFTEYEPRATCQNSQKSTSGVPSTQLVDSAIPITILVAIIVGRRMACVHQ